MNEVLRGIKDLVTETIDKGATTTEDVVKSIFNLPFETLARIGDTAKSLQDLQEQSIGKVYDIIRDMNQQVGEFADDMLDKLEDKEKQRKDSKKVKSESAKSKSKPATRAEKKAPAKAEKKASTKVEQAAAE